MIIEIPYNLKKEDVLKKLGSSFNSGLKNNQVVERRKKYSSNMLPEEKKKSKLILFLGQFNNIFTYFLFGAALVSFWLGEKLDVAVILAVVFINVIIGYFQENKARETIKELKKIIRIKAKVVREAIVSEIDAEDLVPGDLILLDAGDKVPADIRLIKTNNFQTKEHVLTGESNPINKNEEEVLEKQTPLGDRINMAYTGTVVTSGSAKAVVVATGKYTEFGKIATLVKEAEEEQTPLKRRISKMSYWLGGIALIACLIIFLIGVVMGRSVGEMFIFAVTIAVSAIPEGMVVMVTIILTIGMRRILKRQAVVRELIAAETLGSTTVICTDKTGTITTGEMEAEIIDTITEEYKVTDLSPLVSQDVALTNVMLSSVLCNDAKIENPKEEPTSWNLIGEATDVALIEMASRAGVYKNELENKYLRRDIVPFDSDVKYMATLNCSEENKECKIFVKGSVEVLLKYSHYVYQDDRRQILDGKTADKIIKEVNELSGKGYRVIGTAYKTVSTDDNINLEKESRRNLIFTGFIGIRDPIRPQIKNVIKKTLSAGIKIKMITGDHKLTALSIAEDIGLDVKSDEVITGEEFETLSTTDLESLVPRAKIFARVTPKHKLQIVDILQRAGEIVAMTGDGVNDTPALKAADIGVAMGSGSEVAKETSDIILLDNNFKTISAAVEEGRLIFDNLKKNILYLLSDSLSEIILVLSTLLLALPVPILPAQILWINLVADGAPGVALAFEPADKDIMNRKPQEKDSPIVTFEMKLLIIVIGLITGFGVLGIFWWLLKDGYSIEHARTVAFTALSIDSLIYVFSCRTLRYSIFQKNMFSNKYLIWTVLGGIGLQFLAVYLPQFQAVFHTVPLNLLDWGIIAAVAVVVILSIEIIKHYFIIKKTESLPATSDAV
ncbi:MAG: HAD-IC family P-type ATPase [bacterium]